MIFEENKPDFNNLDSYPWWNESIFIKLVWFIKAFFNSDDKSIKRVIKAIQDMEII
jgi:hypothetical protein